MVNGAPQGCFGQDVHWPWPIIFLVLGNGQPQDCGRKGRPVSNPQQWFLVELNQALATLLRAAPHPHVLMIQPESVHTRAGPIHVSGMMEVEPQGTIGQFPFTWNCLAVPSDGADMKVYHEEPALSSRTQVEEPVDNRQISGHNVLWRGGSNDRRAVRRAVRLAVGVGSVRHGHLCQSPCQWSPLSVAATVNVRGMH